MVRAYILVQTGVGRAAEVAARVSRMPGVIACEGVTGPYDIVATVETDDVDALGGLVQEHVQQVEGITRTVTCPVVRL